MLNTYSSLNTIPFKYVIIKIKKEWKWTNWRRYFGFYRSICRIFLNGMDALLQKRLRIHCCYYLFRQNRWMTQSFHCRLPDRMNVEWAKSSKGLSILYCSVNVWNIINFSSYSTLIWWGANVSTYYMRYDVDGDGDGDAVPTTMRECSSYFVVVYRLYMAHS